MKDLNKLDKVLEELNSGVLIGEDELLTEDTIYRNIQDNIYIALTPDESRNFIDKAYFKVSWRPINRSNQYVARIDMRTGNYIIHNNMSIELDNKIIKNLNEILYGPINGYVSDKYTSKDTKTVWDSILVFLDSIYKIGIDKLKIMYPAIYINPDPAQLKNCRIIKWGGK